MRKRREKRMQESAVAPPAWRLLTEGALPPPAMSEQFMGGVLCVDKPAGCSSHDVVGMIRRLYGTKQVGHTGTLDPMATGVLTVMVGRAVKASEFLSCEDKEYEAGIRLGLTTDTEDTEGQTLTVHEGALPTLDEVREAARRLEGRILQVPPMYSALKVGGKKLVDLARRGVELERAAREITVYSLCVEPTERSEELTLYVSCSKGTYIRTLCADLGKLLGCGAAMCRLRRVRSGAFRIEEAQSIERLAALSGEERLSLLSPVEKLFDELPAVVLEPFFARLAHSGCELYQKKLHTAFAIGERVRLYDERGFFAIGEVREYPDGTAIRPIKQMRL